MHMPKAPKIVKTSPQEDIGIPVSVKIRQKLKKAKKRFHANDNIAPFLEPGDLELILEEVQLKMQDVLESLVIDTESDHNTQDTARRVAKMFVREVFAGRYSEIPAITEFPNISRLDELMVIGPLTVRSACSHHLCMQWRGVKDMDSKMLNSVMRGRFLEDTDLRREFLSLLGSRYK